jgi:hypothetical protein
LGAGIVLAAPTIYSTGLGFAYDPEVVSNVVDFIGALDPNPAAPLSGTFWGFAGWVESGGFDDLVDQTQESLNNWWNDVN